MESLLPLTDTGAYALTMRVIRDPNGQWRVEGGPATSRHTANGALGVEALLPNSSLDTWVDIIRRRVEMAPNEVAAPIGEVTIPANPAPTRLADLPVPRDCRTLAQEDRFEYLYFKAECGILAEGEESREYSELYPLRPWPHQGRIPKLRIKIWKDIDIGYRDYRVWNIAIKHGVSNVILPDVKILRTFMPRSEQAKVTCSLRGSYSTDYNLKTALSAGVPVQVVHDAIKAWFISSHLASKDAESTTDLERHEQSILLEANPATLSYGGKLFRLVPTGEADITPLLKRVRSKVIASAQVESVAIKDRASRDGRLVIVQAEEKARAIRDEINREKAATLSRLPDWLMTSGRACRWMVGARLPGWQILLNLKIHLTDIRLFVAPWNTVLHWNPVYPKGVEHYRDRVLAKAWFRYIPSMEGRYSMDDIAAMDGDTTHLAHHGCMDIQGRPTRITSNEDLASLERAISRGLNVINLNSPLSTDLSTYNPSFLEQIPPMVVKFLRNEFRITPRLLRHGHGAVPDRYETIEAWKALYPAITWDRVETIAQEGEGVFAVGDPNLSAPIPPLDPPINTPEGR